MKSLLCHSVCYFCHSARSRRIQYEGQMDSATTVRNDRGQKMDSAIPLRSTQNDRRIIWNDEAVR